MKKLFRNTKEINLLVMALLASFSLWAKSPVAVVGAVKGNAFVSYDGNTVPLKAGQHLYDFSEVFTEVGSQVTINDYYDHQFHLSGSGHMQFLNRIVELKRGYLWLQAWSEQDDFMVQTANSHVTYNKGEGIVSFDPATGKSQILVIKGNWEFGNIFEKFLTTPLEEGQFSFIQKDYENGAPRRATPIGFASYQKVTGLFTGIRPMDKSDGSHLKPRPTMAAKRKIASVPHADQGAEKRPTKESNPVEAVLSMETDAGKVVVRKINDPVQKKKKDKELLNLYKSKLTELSRPRPKKRWAPSYQKKSGVPVRVFGTGQVGPHEVLRLPSSRPKPQVKRVPQSVGPSGRGPASVGGMAPEIVPPKKSSKFESELLNQYKKQMRHSDEMNRLIEDLKSVDMDYQRQY